ncbi:hypothetical protein [Sulfuriflexus mobilis]|uniref:hypothetical protein n=1 Tax=Sulfuriflexus mobilis TaxID=1811807 RepID=UPI000F84413B|nr:hypothetical protein [Sulfuriflexus mobilis]
MEFISEEDAKNYCMGITTGHLSHEEIKNKIDSYNFYKENACSEEDKNHWEDEINKLKSWSNSNEFKNGDYPQGIDELILELIEWRASIYSFQNTDTERNPFKKYVFHAQWLTGGIYAIFCLIGKLVSKDPRDNSLRRLWNAVSGYIDSSGLCGEGELEQIEIKMHYSEGHFSNLNSKAMLYRNKVIAHNESSPRVEWYDVDKDIELLCRIWGLITMWSSLGVVEPFRKGEMVFSALDNVFTPRDIMALKNKREEYLDKVNKWCISSLIDGSTVSDRSPFVILSISSKN